MIDWLTALSQRVDLVPFVLPPGSLPVPHNDENGGWFYTSDRRVVSYDVRNNVLRVEVNDGTVVVSKRFAVGHDSDKYSINLCGWGLFPPNQRPPFRSLFFARGNVVVNISEQSECRSGTPPTNVDEPPTALVVLLRLSTQTHGGLTMYVELTFDHGRWRLTNYYARTSFYVKFALTNDGYYRLRYDQRLKLLRLTRSDQRVFEVETESSKYTAQAREDGVVILTMNHLVGVVHGKWFDYTNLPFDADDDVVVDRRYVIVVNHADYDRVAVFDVDDGRVIYDYRTGLYCQPIGYDDVYHRVLVRYEDKILLLKSLPSVEPPDDDVDDVDDDVVAEAQVVYCSESCRVDIFGNCEGYRRVQWLPNRRTLVVQLSDSRVVTVVLPIVD